jgi:hypothetical protein
MQKNVLWLTLIVLLLTPAAGQAQEPNYAGLVVQFPDGRTETACVEFSDQIITGVDVLIRSGLSVSFDYTSGLGAKVCKIGETGCDYPAQDCWCRCQGLPCAYWNYWRLKDGQWVYSPLGAGSRRLGDGDVDGWVWGDGEQPTPISLQDICPIEATTTDATNLAFTSPLETPTAQPTATQVPQPTATSPDSPLPQPTAGVQPTATPASQVFIPAASGDSPASETSAPGLPPSPDRYVGFAGVLAALGFIALVVWRRRKGT